MALSSELISQFVKSTKSTNKDTVSNKAYGTVVSYDKRYFVKIDGSDLLTPVSSTVTVNIGDRVQIEIDNHMATVVGNVSDPSASGNTVEKHEEKITEFDEVVSYKLTTTDLEAVTATIQNLVAITATLENADIIKADIMDLYAKIASFDSVTAKDVEAINADIDNLRAKFAEIDDISAEKLEAAYGEITNLKGYIADFTYVSAEVLSAMKADIKELDVNKLSAKEAEIKYANIDFSNIGEAAIEKFLSQSGIIEDLILSDGHVTGKLVGVTIIGDLIEGGTIKADKLVVLGEDGLYYKLNVGAETVSAKQTEYNSLNGSIITAKSVTAEKVRVDDLVAFDATIAGLNLTEGSIYSGVKKSVENTTRGFYLDKNGQMVLGDSDNYLKYYKDKDGVYRLVISAGSIIMKSSNKTIEEYMEDVRAGTKNLIRNSVTMVYEKYSFESVPEIDGDILTDEDGNVLIDENSNILYV